jgi:hypothetical protein
VSVAAQKIFNDFEYWKHKPIYVGTNVQFLDIDIWSIVLEKLIIAHVMNVSTCYNNNNNNNNNKFIYLISSHFNLRF